MALIEVVLTYRPTGMGESAPVALARTSDPDVILAVRDRVLAEAKAAAEMWRTIDPGLFIMHAAECERLARVLDVLAPIYSGLSLVGQERGADGDEEVTP